MMIGKNCQQSATSIGGVISCFLCCTTVFADPTPAHSDWLRIVPGDAQFYVELSDLAGIRRRFRELGIWQTIRDLTDRPRSGQSPSIQPRPQEILGINTEAGIEEILGLHCALLATTSDRWQHGVILAELDRADDLAPLLQQWRAKKLSDEGPVRRYLLRQGLLLGVRDRMLVLGPANDPEGLWERTVFLMSGQHGPHLSGRAAVAALRDRLQNPYTGLVYVAWPKGDPYAIAQCRRLILGLHFTNRELRCELHGQRPLSNGTRTPWDEEWIRGLPADTLAAWSGSFSLDFLRHPSSQSVLSDESSVIGLFVSMLSAMDRHSPGLLDTLGPKVTVVLGADSSAEPNDFQLPALTVLCEASDVDRHIQTLDVLIGLIARLINAVATRRDELEQPIRIETRQIDKVELHVIDLGSILAKRLQLDFLKGIEVCWAGWRDRIFFSSSPKHVETILRSMRGQGKRLDNDPATQGILPQGREGNPIVEWTLIRGRMGAQMLASWMKYLRRHRPETLQDAWWQQWAQSRIHQRARLGIALKDDPTRHHAIVFEVEPYSVAANILHIGDVIIRAAGRPLTTPHPAQEVAERYGKRGGGSAFTMEIRRAGQRMELSIPVPPRSPVDLNSLKPIHAVKQLITLLRQAESVTISHYGSSPKRLDAEIVVRWRVPTSAKRGE